MADDTPPFLEVERTWDVDADTPLPDLSALPGIAAVAPAERRDLDARYFDTPALDLARASVALRRRTGGPDEGWHIKAASVGGRLEWAFPLTAPDSDGTPTLPDDLLRVLGRWASPPVVPIARVRNLRVAVALYDAAGATVAEFVDDHVEALDERAGTVTRWREWELELGPAAPSDVAGFFAAAHEAVTAVGGRDAASDSKLSRALGR